MGIGIITLSASGVAVRPVPESMRRSACTSGRQASSSAMMPPSEKPHIQSFAAVVVLFAEGFAAEGFFYPGERLVAFLAADGDAAGFAEPRRDAARGQDFRKVAEFIAMAQIRAAVYSVKEQRVRAVRLFREQAADPDARVAEGGGKYRDFVFESAVHNKKRRRGKAPFFERSSLLLALVRGHCAGGGDREELRLGRVGAAGEDDGRLGSEDDGRGFSAK